MRRLAVQTRNDGYSSKRDYQEISIQSTQRINFPDRVVDFSKMLPPHDTHRFVAFGGFVYPDEATELIVVVEHEPVWQIKKTFQLTDNWNRIGLCFKVGEESKVTPIKVKLAFSKAQSASFWGMEVDYFTPPDPEEVSLDELNQQHLSPETYYFEHDVSLNLDFDEESIYQYDLSDGNNIELKKCSFCQRQLPLRSDLPGSISFHKHNAKISGHQNECRSCKKWRINNKFNPLRTTDQLHESSVITRERKILLREPVILQAIKLRTGEGLKSQVWERFNRKCFYCDAPVELNNFQLDHTRPLAYLWPIDEFATCLCSEHNNLKKDKFPIDFYSSEQLQKLSEITGLSLEHLSIRDVNDEQLSKILSNLSHYARQWDVRTFNAIARKVIEVRPTVDLFELLKAEDEEVYHDVVSQLQDRPDAVIE